MITSKIFSFNNGIGLTLDKTLTDCQDHCDYFNSKICYVKNNRQTYINQGYILKCKTNDKFLKSSNFVQKTTKEIKRLNVQRIRFFSSGDFDHVSKKGLKEIDNLFKLCLKNPFNQFCVFTRNFEVLYQYIENQKNSIPQNLTVIFSKPLFIDESDKLKKVDIHPFLLNWLDNIPGIKQEEYTTDPKKSNCPKSVNGGNCTGNNCFRCFEEKDEKMIIFIHGKHNLKRLEKWRKRP